MDLRKEFSDIIDEYGHYVLVQQTSRNIRCRCWKELYQEADAKCPICLGKGWVSRMVRLKTRNDSAAQITSRPELQQQILAGKFWTDARHFYFEHDAKIKVGDIVYEVGWDKEKPTHLIRAFNVQDIFQYREDGGKVIYIGATCKAETINFTIRNIVIRNLGPVKNYEIIK